MRAWLPVAGWMALVAAGSLVPPIAAPAAANALRPDLWVHAALYAVLGALAARAGLRSGARPAASAARAIALASAYGAAIEWFQTFVARDPSLADWAADVAGAAAGAALALHRRPRPHTRGVPAR